MRFFAMFVLVAVIFSCQSSVPKDVLPPKKMQAVLWDVMQADEMAEYYSVKDSSFRRLDKHADYYQQIFSLHKITKEDFTKSLSYYENHPAALKSILDSLQSIGERLQRADSAKHPNHPVDTVRKRPFLNQQP